MIDPSMDPKRSDLGSLCNSALFIILTATLPYLRTRNSGADRNGQRDICILFEGGGLLIRIEGLLDSQWVGSWHTFERERAQ